MVWKARKDSEGTDEKHIVEEYYRGSVLAQKLVDRIKDYVKEYPDTCINSCLIALQLALQSLVLTLEEAGAEVGIQLLDQESLKRVRDLVQLERQFSKDHEEKWGSDLVN